MNLHCYFSRMSFFLELKLRDQVTSEVWITPAHSDDSRKDDFHGQVKPQILQDLSPSLKKRYGRNCDIDIANGRIVIRSKVLDESTGRPKRIPVITELHADDYFIVVAKYMVGLLIRIYPNYEIRIVPKMTNNRLKIVHVHVVKQTMKNADKE